MKQFLLFIGGLVLLLIIVGSLGPMILLGVSIWLLYVVFKQFMKSETTAGKIGWTIVGLVVLMIGISNIYAVIGLVAVYGLYLIIKNWKNDDNIIDSKTDDPFTNFEKQWAEYNR
ncbi:flagellar basal body rod protein [Ornithinibacillus sp. 4-3]|uniref:Flagellar basal body rod protein n=1 Tax=Ornithinibacillus sp. 4-3 TaxID=3231488 RepID=A0AB39HMD8_9BACI